MPRPPANPAQKNQRRVDLDVSLSGNSRKVGSKSATEKTISSRPIVSESGRPGTKLLIQGKNVTTAQHVNAPVKSPNSETTSANIPIRKSPRAKGSDHTATSSTHN